MSTDPTALAREVLDAEAHATPEPWAHGDVDADETQTVAEWLAACALSPDAPAAGRVWSTWTRGDDGGVIVPAVTGDGPTSAGNAALIALLRTAGPALARAVIAVSELHRPIKVYNECDDPECPNDHIDLLDYQGCDATVIGWACEECCYHDEHPLECKDHGGDHTGVTADQACSTRTALNGDAA